MQRPASSEYGTMFQAYVDRVPDGDVLARLRSQAEESEAMFSALTEEQGDHAYAEGKWSVKRLLQHLVDAERMFCYRAMCVARGDTNDLPGFDENAYAEQDGSDSRPLTDVLAEFLAVRAATIALFEGFDGTAWTRSGTANGASITVRALPWLIAGHELHHVAILHERYGIG
ncbi:MAG: DinB family protein [bacterium]|nr:DinB family protein [bacterium]